MILAGSGCGPRKIVKDVKNNPPEERALHTGAGQTINRKKGGGPVQWVVEWKSAEISYLTETRYGGMMNQVKGAIYEKGKTASSFKADRAQADKEAEQLVLSGNVTLTSAAPKSTISCGRVTWDAAHEVVKAQENVNLNTLDYKMGSIPELWATPKMDFIATPALFGKPGNQPRMDMHSLKIGLMAAAAAAASSAAVAQQTNAWVFEDRGGNMTVDNIRNTQIRTLPDGKIKFTFSGSPLHATWKDQGITIDTPKLVGTAEPAGSGRYRLVTASMGDSVAGKIVRPSANLSSQQPQTASLNSRDATYDAKAGRLTLTGELRIESVDEGAGQNIVMTGSSGTVDLGPAEKNSVRGGIKSAAIEGPTTIDMTTKEKVESGALHEGHATGKGDRLLYELVGGERKITLTGRAKFDFAERQTKNGEEIKTESRSVSITGNQATAVLAARAEKGEKSLRSAKVDGSVDYKVLFNAVDGGDVLPAQIVGVTDHLKLVNLTAAERKDRDPGVVSVLSLIGNVDATSGPSGYHAIQGGSIKNWDELVMELDAKGKVLSIEGKGTPGETTITRNPPAPKSKKTSKGKAE